MIAMKKELINLFFISILLLKFKQQKWMTRLKLSSLHAINYYNIKQ